MFKEMLLSSIRTIKNAERRNIYVLILIAVIFTMVNYFYIIVYTVGKALDMGILIRNPDYKLFLTSETLQIVSNIRLLLAVNYIFNIVLSILVFFIVYKEYQEYCVQKIIKENCLDVIK